MAKYRLFWSEDDFTIVKNAEIDEQIRAVKEVVDPKPETSYKYHYYPFEKLQAIVYLGED